MDQSIEQWLPVVGFEGSYEVSDHGRVRSITRVSSKGRPIAGRMMKPTPRDTGHLYVSLSHAGVVTKRYVHAVVLEAFVGSAPDGHVTCHRDGDPSNNSLANLRWGTQQSNVQDEMRHGTHAQAAKTQCPRGHVLALPNLTAWSVRRGQRACLACQRAWSVAQHSKSPFSRAVADEKYRQIMA